jgi:hypothetical protein
MQQISDLLEKPMDRKDFLRHMGVGALMLLGGNIIYQAVTGVSKNRSSSNVGYGTSAYGGNRR